MPPEYWSRPPADWGQLLQDEVHVWKVCLPDAETAMEQLSGFLSPDESSRAGRFVRDRDSVAFSVTRGILRVLLARYVNTEPRTIAFKVNEFGKPELLFPSRAGIEFNVSHSGDYSLLAFSRVPVGVDIQQTSSLSFADLAPQVFSEPDYLTFKSLTADDQRAAFFNAWTRKEAMIKAIGRGVSIPLTSFDVSFLPTEPARLRCMRSQDFGPVHWSILALEVGDGYSAALAVAGAPGRVRHFAWH